MNTLLRFFSTSNVLFIYELYKKELVKYTLTYVKTSEVTENGCGNDSFCFTFSNRAGKFKVHKIKNDVRTDSLT